MMPGKAGIPFQCLSKHALAACCGAVLLFLSPVLSPAAEQDGDYEGLKNSITAQCGGVAPGEWGEHLPGIVDRLAADDKAIALTFDACGSKNDGYDEKLIGFLKREKIPATLFINARWIDKNPATFRELARDPLFEIENHGLRHAPASVNGRSAYGIPGTAGIPDLVDEIELNARKIEGFTGRKPKYYRSGTAYYDEVAVAIVRSLGYEPAGYSILGDAGATFTKEQVCAALLSARPGDIVICHMNHPGCGTADGIMAAVPVLKSRGYTFVTLDHRVRPCR